MTTNARHSGSSTADGVGEHEPKRPPTPPPSQITPVSPSEKQLPTEVNPHPEQETTTETEKDTKSPEQHTYDEQPPSHYPQAFEGLSRLPSEGLPSNASALRNTMSRVTTDAEGNTYPEGGLGSWLVVFGSFLGLFGSLGLINTIGTFQAYIQQHQLKEYGSGNVGWIFGVYTFLGFLCGVQIGPIFDARGPRLLVLTGSILTIVQMIALGFCTEYWHFMLVIGITGGLGASLIFTPAIAAVSHWFMEKRGGMFPLINYFVVLLTTISCNWHRRDRWFSRSRLPKKPFSKKNVLPDFFIFREPKFALTTAGIFFIEWGVFIPISYISSYALDHGISDKFSYQLLAILNAGSFFGRWLPGFFADFLGRFNTLIATVALCLLCVACLWLPAGDNLPVIVVFAVLFGFSSGSNISLTPVCVGQLCKTEHYGRYYATAYTVVSFG
ncbi:Monocarboxylate transporter [Aspergillus sclerotialis]|uniref:Monocarboxylate transporter n=1 Tax=Aspergillus sclerotialis TaxID=2070753 RepID=A0A3A2ZB83_9EURO|nr:Monocarboxylate transporter [Aspergillus sclerotialis]